MLRVSLKIETRSAPEDVWRLIFDKFAGLHHLFAVTHTGVYWLTKVLGVHIMYLVRRSDRLITWLFL
jgi:hypothetical protein